MARRWNFKGYISNLNRKKNTLPRKISIVMKNHFVESFAKQGFVDRGRMAWAKRKRSVDQGRAILVKTGALRKSIFKKKATWREIRVGTYTIRYSSVHNRGLGNMPKRQFIGRSFEMTKKIQKLILADTKQIFR